MRLSLYIASEQLANARRSQRSLDEPKCQELRRENEDITKHLLSTKEKTNLLVKDIEDLRVEKASVLASKVC